MCCVTWELETFPKILVWNKSDCGRFPYRLEYDPDGRVEAVFVSALKREGLSFLREAIVSRVSTRDSL